MPYSDWLHITDGTEQGGRFPAALEEGYFAPDEQSFTDLLAMGAHLAAKLNFYNLRFEKDGSWAGLFAGDEAAILAMILSRDLQRLEADFLRRYASSGDNQALAGELVRLAAMIDFWFRKLTVMDSPPARTVSWQIASMVENELAVELHTLGACRLRQGEGAEDDPLFAGFHPIWQLGRAQGRLLFHRSALAGAETAEQIRRRLHATFYALLNALSFLKKGAETGLADSLASRGHNPAMALFMAFLTLYGKARDSINRFQERHLDFYYRQLLHLSPRPRQADGTYLLFDADPDAGEILIPGGTDFIAGRDTAGRELLFRTDNDLVVTDLRVQELRTLYFRRDRSISPERELGYVTRVQAREIPLATAGTAAAWPLFGAGQSSGSDARFGFALATPVLLLREGRREIEISLIFTSQSTAEAAVSSDVAELMAAATEQEFFAAFGRVFGRYLLAGRNVLGKRDRAAILDKAEKTVPAGSYALLGHLLQQERQDLFYTMLPKIFTVELTGEKGWHTASWVTVKRVPSQGRKARDGLCFSFTLGPEVSPIIPYAPQLHGEGFATRVPVVRFRTNPLAHFSPCSLFDEVAVKEFRVEARVTGAGQLLAYNSHGQLDPTKPFHPFGPLPTGNSYLVIGNYEAALKPLSELRLNLEWGDLPKEREGFREYYQGYGTGYTNDCFTTELSLLRDGNWFPQPGAVSLFDSRGDAVAPTRTMDFSVLNYAKPLEPSLQEDAYRLDLRIRGGFFKITLTGPDNAFGHRVYPTLLSAALSANARKKPKQQLPPPNAPYTPLINRITLDYTARTTIKAGIDSAADRNLYGDKPFHLHPFGMAAIRAHGDRKFHRLLPRYHYDGNLFIGFTARRAGGVVTLFFHLREDSRRSATGASPEIAWFYLASNRWHRLGNDRILADTTNAFLASGIVSLDIPDQIDRDSSIMPNNLYWLRVAAKTDLDTFCSVYSVQAQAVHACRVMGDGEGMPHTLAPGAISEPKQTIPGITGVSQPVASSGGRGEEQPARMKTRISERLRHKNRATMPWDYERLVLEQFPEVFKVKCFAAMQSDSDRPRPGSVLVVVVPELREDGPGFDPMLSAVELNRIRDFLKGHASPHVTLEVRNPVYEQIQVRCSVVLARQADAQRGHYLGRLNQAIVDYISPWCAYGYKARFGWCIRRADIESYLRQLPYVEFVTNFSMLHITGNSRGDFTLEDTARPAAGESPDIICPQHPWSLAIPVGEHAVEAVASLRSLAAEVTGIDKLQVGQTFIIGA